MMKTIKSLFISVALLPLALAAPAQVVTTANGYPVIDLSALSPLGATLTKAEADARRTTMYTKTPSNNDYLDGNGSLSGSRGTWNAKMSARFQVMRANRNGQQNWITAWNACKGYTGEGGAAGQWRLPTQRELQMIWVLHPQLIGQGGATAFTDGFYWSSTEDRASSVRSFDFKGSNTGSGTKTTTTLYYVRCVRDL